MGPSFPALVVRRLLGKRASNSPYLDGCTLLWWAVAVDELRSLELAGKSLAKLSELWRADFSFISFIKDK